MIIKLDCKQDFIVKEAKVTHVEVHPISFMKFVDLASGVQRSMGNNSDEKLYSKLLFRARIKAQVKAFAGTSPVALDDITIGQMPAILAVQIRSSLTDANFEETDQMPQVVSKGDGVSSPVHIKLGRPIKVGEGKSSLAELEMLATNLDQLEDAILADNKLEQVASIIKIAKPVSTDSSLMALPSWALDQISLQDGLWMMTAVLPSFFGEAESL